MEELPAIIKVENERVTSGDTVVELTEGQSKYLDSNIIIKEEIRNFSDDLSNNVSINSPCEVDIKQELDKNIEVPDDVSAEDISTLTHDIKIEIEECDLSQIKMETEESNSTSTSSEQTKHVTNNTLEDDLCVKQPEQFTCASCNKSFTSKYSLIMHIKNHDRKLKHACQYCPNKATQAIHLKRHTLTHTEEKPHACQYCPFKTTQPSSLKQHILIHTGEKPHACQYCPYKARQVSNLKRHELTHTGEKPHACQYCPHKTSSASYLKKHMLIHTPHACQYCPYKATQASNLKRHMLKHNEGKKTHSCQYCPYKASQSSALKKHILTHDKLHSCVKIRAKIIEVRHFKVGKNQK